MASTLEVKLRTQASVYAPLTALLGTAPFRWYDTQEVQGSVLPAVTVLQVSGNPLYAAAGRLSTGFSRVQFTIWDTDAERGRAVESALLTFLDQFNGVGISGLVQYPSQVLLQRTGFFAEPSPPRWLRYVDASIFSNNTV